jgi:hypothetical protein
MKMKKTVFLLLFISVVFIGSFAPVSTANSGPFQDVQPSHWAYNSIVTVANQGIIEGYPGNQFRPGNQVTRAEFMTMLTRLLDIQEGRAHAFTDLGSHWANDAVEKAVYAGLINPSEYANGRFQPNEALKRNEMAKIMTRGLVYLNEGYAQAIEDTRETLLPIPEYFKGGLAEEDIPYIAVVMGTGLITGYEDYTFRPSHTTTRAEVATLLVRFLNVMDKQPEDFLHLEEMRHVGVKGTNVDLVTSYREAEGREFTNIKDKPIDVKGGYMKLHRIIFINPWDENEESIYQKMFYDAEEDKWLTERSYLVVAEKSYELTVEIPDPTRFFVDYYREKSIHALVEGSRISGSYVDAFGYTTLGKNSIEMLKHSGGPKYWEVTTVRREDGPFYSIFSADGSSTLFTNRR